MAMRRSNAMAACAAGLIHVMGGWGDGGCLMPEDEAFDPGAGVWAPMATMPTRRVCGAAVAAGAAVCVVGGLGAEGIQLQVAERYASELPGGSSEWAELPELTTPRSDCAAAVVDGLVYVVGGRSRSGRHLSTVERLAPGGGGWEAAPRLPSERVSCAAASLGGCVYVFGGWGRARPVDSADRLDPAVGVWERLPPMPTPRAVGSGAATACCGKLYVFGGRACGAQAIGAVERFDPRGGGAAGFWEVLPPMPQARTGIAVVTEWR